MRFDKERGRKIKNENTNSIDRINNFNRAVIFGPIFICSWCHRKLFENVVNKITQNFKQEERGTIQPNNPTKARTLCTYNAWRKWKPFWILHLPYL